MSDNSETAPKHAETTASSSSSSISSSNAQSSGNASSNQQSVHRSPQKNRQSNHNTSNHNSNHNNNNHSGRKRRYTVGAATEVSKSYQHQKRRRKDDPFEPPTVFKLGGNIHDPLNLNGISANGQTTPISSPFPSPFPLGAGCSGGKVEVLIPPNICDPLNLSGPNALNESDLISPTDYNNKSAGGYNSRQRNKRRRTSSETEVINEVGGGGGRQQQRSGSFHDKFRDDSHFLGRGRNALNRSNRDGKFNAERKISPVVASAATAAPSTSAAAAGGGKSNHPKFSRSNSQQQSGTSNRGNAANNSSRNPRQGGCPSTADAQGSGAPSTSNSSTTLASTSSVNQGAKRAVKNNKERFRFGNYNRYYGYRNSQHCDRRLELLPRDLIQGKDVLDVGCNIGHVTLSLARDYGPRRIVGVDIDRQLIEVAKRNIRHYITEAVVQKEQMPLSMPLLYGPLGNVPRQEGGEESREEEEKGGFPNNVFFLALNYVPESDDLLEFQEEEYDCIICLSLTKWIHLNWGDAGIRRLFMRTFRQLRPGGVLILEPQPWSSYQKKAKLTPQIQATYRSIRFRPDQFNEYLLKDVGFKSCELLGTPVNTSKGFQRPIYLYKKSPTKSATEVTKSEEVKATEVSATSESMPSTSISATSSSS